MGKLYFMKYFTKYSLFLSDNVALMGADMVKRNESSVTTSRSTRAPMALKA